MGIKVTDKGGVDFKKLDPGSHAAVCTQIVGIGLQDSPYGHKERIKIRFEVPAERTEWEVDGVKKDGPMVQWATYTASLSKKSILRKDLEAWRGREFTAEELAGFDLDKILGQPCLLSIVHNTVGDKVYANIASIGKLPKGMEIPKAEGPLVSFDVRNHTDAEFNALPEWLRKLVTAGIQAIEADEVRAADEYEVPPDDGFEEDSIPF